MDTVSAALIAANAIDATLGVARVGELSVRDNYITLKSLLEEKYGEESDLMEALERLELKSDSTERRSALQQAVEANEADQDSAVQEAADELLREVLNQPGGPQVIQELTGNYYV
ncbi:MAG: hypothetical protein M3220_19245 [Chloroflexota bacterium]|nr:hypothetical protein [Chloroflexota bacterium]